MTSRATSMRSLPRPCLSCGDWNIWCNDPHQTDDLVQAALERVFAAWPRVQHADDPLAYTRTAMVRVLISQRRRS